MTKMTHFGSNRLFGLSKAVLVYSDAQEAFATVHEAKPSPDGGAPYLDAGQPLTIDFLKQLAKSLGRTTPCEILPRNVLVYTADMLVWWCRRQHRVMFYGGSSDGRTLSGKVFPQPPLVFKVCGSELSVRALTEDRRPRPETTLMVAPYWNCDRHGGRVCQGSMRVPGSLCLADRQAWENAFFLGEFTHAALGAQLANHALALLSRLFRFGRLQYHGGFVSLASGAAVPLRIDPRLWARIRARNKRLSAGNSLVKEYAVFGP
jgi:PRTRC genetic system protein B